MTPIELHEQFEMEVLQLMNNNRLLNNLVFGGGTMLRLCYELNRYSVDLDFYFKKPEIEDRTFEKMERIIGSEYNMTDVQNKYKTMLFECRSDRHPMRLKIEINKQKQYPNCRQHIAFSRFSTIQVLLNTMTLEDMMKNKVQALLSRKEIRDAFDMEFLVRRGIALPSDMHTRSQLLTVIRSFSKKDFKVKLGSILPSDVRGYYTESGFALLERHLSAHEKLGSDL